MARDVREVLGDEGPTRVVDPITSGCHKPLGVFAKADMASHRLLDIDMDHVQANTGRAAAPVLL